jgi:hypothetical protein
VKRSIWIVGGVVVLALVLGAAAFVGGRLLNTKAQAQTGGKGMQISLVGDKGGAGGEQRFEIQTEPARELPQTPPDVGGIYVRRADASIFIGTGQVTVMAQMGPDGNVTMSSNHDGPEVEVVLTHDTIIYKDVTMRQFDGQPVSGKVQQVVEPGSADEIGENSTVAVWGERRGDRVIAQTLLYSPAAFMVKPGAPGDK